MDQSSSARIFKKALIDVLHPKVRRHVAKKEFAQEKATSINSNNNVKVSPSKKYDERSVAKKKDYVSDSEHLSTTSSNHSKEAICAICDRPLYSEMGPSSESSLFPDDEQSYNEYPLGEPVENTPSETVMKNREFLGYVCPLDIDQLIDEALNKMMIS